MASGSQNMTTFKAKGLTSIANAVDTSNFIFLKSTTLTADQLGNTVSLSLNAVGVTGAAVTNHSLFLNAGVGSGLGTPFQLQIPDSSHLYIYKRWYTSGAWSGWSKICAGTADTWTTARTLTIGATGKSVNGSANVSWSKDEILGSSTSAYFLRGDKAWSNTLTGEYITTSANGYRIKYGSYGVFLRNDGSDTYILLTASGDQGGNWNSLRPFRINNASGKLYSSNGQLFEGNTTFNGIAYFANGTTYYINNSGTAKLNDATIAGTLYLTRTTDAEATADNRPALLIGPYNGAHLEFDGNEIMAKGSATTTSTLYLNNNGGRTYFGGDISCASTLTIRAQNTTTEGGEILLSPATSSLKECRIDNCNNQFRIFETSYERFKINLSNGDATITGNAYIGKYTANTAQSQDYQIQIQGGSGGIYMFSQAATTGVVGIGRWTAANAWSYQMYWDQSNNLYIAGSTSIQSSYLSVGSTTATVETSIVLYGKSGSFSLYSHSDDGAHGLWAHAHGTDTTGKNVFYLDTNNNVLFSGDLSGNATTATTASYLSAPNVGGYHTDDYGNFIHNSADETNYFCILNNAGHSAMKVYFETGAAEFTGTVTATQFNGPLNGNAATATKLSNTPNNTTTFLRGDNTWSNTLIGQLYINYDQDVGLNQNGSLIIGTKAGQNISFDANEIMSRNNGAASTLYIQNEGGAVQIGAPLTVNSTIYSSDIRGGNIRLTSNWVGFYQNANAGGSRYGYIQTDGSLMNFVKENGGYFRFNTKVHIYGNTYPSLHLERTDAGEVSQYFSNNTAGWAIGINPWGVGAGVFAIGQYSGTGSSTWRLKIDNNGYVFTSSYLNLGGGHEKNASSPTYVWGSNSSDSYLRSYQTAYLNVNSAGYLRSLGRTTPETGRTSNRGGVYCYGTYNAANMPHTYCSVIGFGCGTAGQSELCVSWTSDIGVWVRSLRDTTDNWFNWVRLPTATGGGASGTWGISISGNAATATTWQTARTLTIGATGKSVNGSANVSWSMNEIMGASDSSKFYRGDKTWSNTLVGPLTISASGSNRATLYVTSPADVPLDVWLGTNNTSHWSISVRETANPYLGFYANGVGWAMTMTKANRHIEVPVHLYVGGYNNTSYGLSASSIACNGNLLVSANNANGGGIILSDDGDIVDLNDGYCSMRFSSGIRIYTGNRSGSVALRLGTDKCIEGPAGILRLYGNFHIDSLNGYSLYLNYYSPSYNIYLGNQGYCIHNNGANYNGTAANADTVDGYHSSAFLRYEGWWDSSSGYNVDNANGMTFTYASHGAPNSWGITATFDYTYNSAYKTQFHVTGYDCVPYVRTRSADRGGWTGWKRMWCAGDSVTGAVWNDYAEYRKANNTEPGRCVYELGNDSLAVTTTRLQHFAGIVSDTWGFSQGKTEEADTPIAVSGRVLAYPYRNRNEYQPGDCVCAAPNGTVDIMTRDEVALYPDRIVGTVSCVPDYDEWGSDVEHEGRKPAKVNGRIWIKVK